MLNISTLMQGLRNLRANIKVATKFPEQVKQIDKLLSNDKTGIVSTIRDFMIHSATVPMKIETQNKSLNDFLQIWQKRVLNKNVNIAIPLGLRALSAENYKERWRSSLLALKVIWGEEKFGNNKTWIVPKKMWILNGGAVITEPNTALNTRKFFLKINKKKNIELKNKENESIFIRRPFTAWHQDDVVPYLTQRGTVFNALMKNAITQKQSDVIEAILPILLQLKAGSENALIEGMNPSEEDFKKLKNKLIEAKVKFDENGSFGDIIASLRHDVNLDYLIPDLTKIFDDGIVKSTDRNLLSSLGMIELQGFSSTRQEAILNPKVLVEEVTDAVLDWASLLEDVMIEMLERNKENHPTLTNGEIRVIPGNIKAFITDDMKALLRSMYDRGILSKQTGAEDIAGIDFEVEVERRTREDERDLQTVMKPPVIQNIEKDLDPELDDNNLENQDKKPGTPEADNFNNALLKYYPRKKKGNKEAEIVAEKIEIMAPYDTLDELPKNVKSVLPVSAQLIWLKVFNSIFEETGDEDRARKGAWSKVKEKYEKDPDKKKWQKKACLEDYESSMSPYTFKFFKDVYNTAFSQADSSDKAIQTALAIIERVATKNKNGVWVKDKTITKAQIQSLDSSDLVGKLLDLEIKEKKLEMLNKILKEDK